MEWRVVVSSKLSEPVLCGWLYPFRSCKCGQAEPAQTYLTQRTARSSSALGPSRTQSPDLWSRKEAMCRPFKSTEECSVWLSLHRLTVLCGWSLVKCLPAMPSNSDYE